ncbi:hypothetical protein, partial [Chryseobacterium indologenes]|uniref:hypothetical protein n=1 Tax=Chryseobacterium indologenes TaxID=253 RepID=UPI001E4F1F7C
NNNRKRETDMVTIFVNHQCEIMSIQKKVVRGIFVFFFFLFFFFSGGGALVPPPLFFFSGGEKPPPETKKELRHTAQSGLLTF